MYIGVYGKLCWERLNIVGVFSIAPSPHFLIPKAHIHFLLIFASRSTLTSVSLDLGNAENLRLNGYSGVILNSDVWVKCVN